MGWRDDLPARAFRALTKGSRRRKHFLQSHISGHGGEVSSKDGISIAQHMPRRLVPGKSSNRGQPDRLRYCVKRKIAIQVIDELLRTLRVTS
jgi:hypothetical protein